MAKLIGSYNMKHLILIMGLILLLNSGFIQAQSATTLQNPVAYIGQDHNVYITDGDTTIQVTDDAFTDYETGNWRTYSHPQWSPDGTKLVFVAQGSLSASNGIWLLEFGTTPRFLPIFEDQYGLNTNTLTWSPDSAEIAFFGFNQDGERGVFRHSLSDGTTHHVTTAYSRSIGEPNAIDPALGMVARERDFSLYSDHLALAWSSAGIVLTGHEDTYGVTLVSPDGDIVWVAELLTQVTFSIDGSRLFAFHNGLTQWVTIDDFSTGEVTPLDLPEGARPVGWIGDNLLYRTRSDLISVTGATDFEIAEVGMEIYDYSWSFTAESAMLHLWMYDPNADDKQVFRLRGGNPPIYELSGYDIALVDSHDASNIVIRYVTSNVPAVLAINQGASADDVRPLVAQTRAIIGFWDDDGEDALVRHRYTVDGQYVVYSSGEFEWIFE